MENRILPGIIAGIPNIPLPNPGEGGAVYPGDDTQTGQVPVIPLPNPGEGGAVYPGTTQPQRPPVAIQPLPGYWPAPGAARVRFLNATHGYPAFRILIDGARAVNLLPAQSLSGYTRVSAGLRTVSVVGRDGYVYLEQQLRFNPGASNTVVVSNRQGGLRLDFIRDNS